MNSSHVTNSPCDEFTGSQKGYKIWKVRSFGVVRGQSRSLKLRHSIECIAVKNCSVDCRPYTRHAIDSHDATDYVCLIDVNNVQVKTKITVKKLKQPNENIYTFVNVE